MKFSRLKQMYVLSALIILLVCAGCEGTRTEQPIVDQCLRQQLFEKCMASLPEGPDETVYNDWDEVVDSCGQRAYFHSLRLRKFVKEECRANN